MEREKLTFEYFFNAGIDRTTGECDVEGSDIFLDGHYVGSVNWKTPDEREEMTDDELEEEFACSGIIL